MSEETLTRNRFIIYSLLAYAVPAIINPHFILLYHLKGFSSDKIGFLMGIYFLSGMVGPLFISNIVQRHQNYKFMLGIIPLVIIGMTFLIGVTSHYVLSLLVVFFFGFMYHSFFPTMDASIVKKLHNPHKNYGIVRTVGTLGYVLTSFLIAAFGFINIESTQSILRSVFVVLIIACIIPWILIPRSRDNRAGALPAKQLLSASIKSFPRMYFVLLGLLFLNYVGLLVIGVYLSLFVKQNFGVTNVTSFGVVASASEMIIILFGHRIVDRIGYSLSLLLILLSTTIRLLLFSMAGSVIEIYLAQILHMAGFGLGLSTFIHFINHHIHAEQKVLSMGLFQVTVSGGSIIASVLGGYVLAYSNFQVLFLSISIFPFLGVIITLFLWKRLNLITV